MDELLRMFGGLRMRRNHYPSDFDSDDDDEKMFGYYKCVDCKRQWQSAHSWKGFGQNCKGCGKNTMPYKQEELFHSGENKIDASKPHQKHLCAKCKKVGDCTKRY